MPYTDGFHIHILVLSISSDVSKRIIFNPVIKKPFGSYIVIHTNNMRRTGIIDKKRKFFFMKPEIKKILIHRMPGIYFSKQKIIAEPAPGILKIGLVLKGRCAIRLSQVFGLNKFCISIYQSYFFHGQYDPLELIQEHPAEIIAVFLVREPMPIQATKSCCGERLIDGSIILNERKFFSNLVSIISKQVWKVRIQKFRKCGATAVM